MEPGNFSGVGFEPELAHASEARILNAQHEGAGPGALVAAALELYRGRLAVVSSFGAESAVLLHLVAEIDRSLPVIFVDTRKHFGETLRFRDKLAERLGLSDVRSVRPDEEDIAAEDADGGLWLRNADQCCHIRKVLPLARGLEGFDAWISGRKRFQASTRSVIPAFEADNGRIKVNPLAAFTPKDIATYLQTHDLPLHPLVKEGYPSIGCMPCTDKVAEGEDPRAGRWRGQAKTECGIHFGGTIAERVGVKA